MPRRLILPLLLITLFTTFSLSTKTVFADDDTPDPENKLFTESDDFKMYSRNRIFFYEPCENPNDGDDDSDDPFASDLKLIVGGSTMLEKLASAAASFAPGAAGVGIYTVITQVSNVPDFNPLTPYNLGNIYGFIGWSESQFKDLKNTILADERFAEVKDELKDLYDNPSKFPSASSSLKNYVIAAEFVYYYKKYGRVDISGSSNETGDFNKEDAEAAARNFCHKMGSACETELDISPEDYATNSKFVQIQSGELSMSLTSSDTSDYLTHSLIIGDSLTYRAESNIMDNKDYFGRQISTLMNGFDTSNIDADNGREFTLSNIESIINNHKNKNIKYIIIELGNNNCTGSGCTLEKTTIENAIKKLNEAFVSVVDGNPYIHLVLGYRRYNEVEEYSEPSYNNLYRELSEDTSDDFKKVSIADWPSWVKNKGGENALLQNIGHPTKDGAIALAKLYQSVLSDAQASLLSSRDTEPCERAIRTRRREQEVEPEPGEDDPEFCVDGSDCEPGGGGGGGGGGGSGSSPTPQQIKSRLKKYWMGQCNEPFSNISFSRNNICTDGCANTSFSMALSIMYDKKITPADTITWTGKWRTQASTSISIIETMVQGARNAGYSGMRASSGAISITQSNVDKLLNKGQIIFISCRGGVPCARTGKVTDGHFIAIVGIDPDKPENYLIANSHGKDPFKTKHSYPKSTIINMYKGGGRSRAMWRVD